MEALVSRIWGFVEGEEKMKKVVTVEFYRTLDSFFEDETDKKKEEGEEKWS